VIHNFTQSLRHEREQADAADLIYREYLHPDQIIRYSNDTPHDREMQKKDIDVSLVFGGKTFHISEKFRDNDYGDMYLEVYSKYPGTKGWLLTGSPDAIVYFTPAKVYWIGHHTLIKCYMEHLQPLLKDEWFDEIFVSGKNIIKKNIRVNQRPTTISIIQAHNRDGAAWETIGIAIPFRLLTDNGVKIKIIKDHLP